MINYYNFFASSKRKIHIEHDFPTDILILVMRPFLRLYFRGMFGLNTCNADFYLKEFFDKLFFFQMCNRKFGRIFHKCQLKSNNKFVFRTTYNQNSDQLSFLHNFKLLDVFSIFEKERNEDVEISRDNDNDNDNDVDNISI